MDSSGILPVTEADVQEAKARRERKKQAYHAARRELIRITGRQSRLESRCRYLARTLNRRVFWEGATTRVGGCIIIIVSSSASALILGGLLRLSAFWAWGLLVVTTAMAFRLGLALLVPSDDEIRSQIRNNEIELPALKPLCERAEQEVSRTRRYYEFADKEYRGRLEAYSSRANTLLVMPWQGMTGVDFEDFLASVFQYLGYTVEPTKATGDQGVDLLLSKNGRRVAVQVKGYPGTTVGNKAV